MKRILMVAGAMLLVASLVPVSAWAFGVKDVMAMSQYGIPDSLIIEKIRHSGTQFDLNAKDLLQLKAAKVPDEVVVAMLRTEDRSNTPIYYGGRFWPYDPSWYLGFDFDYFPYHPRYYAPVRFIRGGYWHHGYGRR